MKIPAPAGVHPSPIFVLAGAVLTLLISSGAGHLAARTQSAAEIVLYASDASSTTGWTFVNDATAAGGRKLSTPDAGWSSTSSPPAGVAPTASFTINVTTAGTYRFWMRMRGKADSKYNESVWVQFSNATRNGTPVYRWGTSNALLVNLEDCSSCGIQAWGWQDNAWWLAQSSAVSLPQGPQTIYVTVREDGVEFDQLVLSPERHLAIPPGPVKNDTTIVAKPSTTDSSTLVLHAIDAGLLYNLSLASDPTAAGSEKITSGNMGWSSPDRVPAPGTAPYAGFAFHIPESGAYRLWLRLRGQGDSKFNESVWVQFSDAFRNGAPVYRWGTSDALLVNLENCSNCGIQGWGWQDNSWWLNQSSLVQLNAGTQQLYVTVREDGVEIDQIVLSRETYLTNAPGAVKNDSRVLAKTAPRAEVQVTGTYTQEDDRNGALHVWGPDGFSIAAGTSTLGGGGPIFDSCGYWGCAPGTSVSLDAGWIGSDLPGKSTYAGRTYRIGGVGSGNAAEVMFQGSVVMPGPSSEPATVTVPFTATGSLEYSSDSSLPSQRVGYFGHGSATFTLVYDPAAGRWFVDHAELVFETP